MEFKGFPKIPRLNRHVVITEKVDGTNAVIGVDEQGKVWAGSKNRWLSAENDNHGFYKWVMEREAEIVRLMGPGMHYGEFWGSGIGRNYGMRTGVKNLALFNTKRWEGQELPEGVGVVPVLATAHFFDTYLMETCIDELGSAGSALVPGYMNPEGIVVYHQASGQLFKVTLENDGQPKGQKE